MEKISIIVPVYNVKKYLEKCVDSIINQTYKNLEIILVDDGSTDGSSLLCDELSKKDERIVVIHKKNGGLSDARNKGLEIATADLVGFIDSDDYIDNDMYEVLYNNMKNYDADLSMCGHYDIFPNYQDKQVIEKKIYNQNSEEAIKMVMEAKILSVTAVNKLYKKQLFADLKFEVGKIAEDAFIMIKLLSKCQRVVATNEKKYYYIHREGSITTAKFSEKFFNVIEAYEQNYEIIERNFPNLLDVAKMRLVWAKFYVLDRLLVDNNYQNKRKENELIHYLKENTNFILGNKYFTKGRKIAFLLLLVNRNLYKKTLNKKRG